MITLSIDTKTIQVAPDTNVLKAALDNGIHIPHLCYHPELSISGGCRLCLVEVEGQDQPVLSCGLTAAEGMVIQTQSDQLKKLRRGVLDLFISDHPLDCVVCDKAGSCTLQEYAYEYGLKDTSYEPTVSSTLFQDENPFFLRDHQYCILCGRCVRVCDEIVGVHAIDFANRGFETNIATPYDGPMIDSTCVFCGNCVQVCPTAALMPVSRLQRGREWDLDRTLSVCGYCGVGCQIEYATKDDAIIYAQAPEHGAANGTFLCTKGRYGWDFATSPERLKQPMLRRDVAHELGLTEEPWALPETSPLDIRKPNVEQYFVPVDWDTALEFVSSRLSDITESHGPDSIMGLASARCTNEDNYLFQKFMRAVIGTNNIDHCARL